MLPPAARLTRSQDFGLVVRRGRRAGRPRLVVHALTPDVPTLDSSKVGFVVSKAVGNSVVRHRVSRRLRHVVRAQLESLPPGTLVVVRALAPAAEASSSELAADLSSALRKVLR
ncbi:ribonuclease P protein component [Lentzea nigeriaca]|uniref:ribonuclease P protein component n=1 Tax=Lentzea nigeriaca TaxID=1128665 RepID=UPI00195E7091|nr:ribonuclease P protein component [Lentzea nigeriaca]